MRLPSGAQPCGNGGRLLWAELAAAVLARKLRHGSTPGRAAEELLSTVGAETASLADGLTAESVLPELRRLVPASDAERRSILARARKLRRDRSSAAASERAVLRAAAVPDVIRRCRVLAARTELPSAVESLRGRAEAWSAAARAAVSSPGLLGLWAGRACGVGRSAIREQSRALAALTEAEAAAAPADMMPEARRIAAALADAAAAAEAGIVEEAGGDEYCSAVDAAYGGIRAAAAAADRALAAAAADAERLCSCLAVAEVEAGAAMRDLRALAIAFSSAADGAAEEPAAEPAIEPPATFSDSDVVAVVQPAAECGAAAAAAYDLAAVETGPPPPPVPPPPLADGDAAPEPSPVLPPPPKRRRADRERAPSPERSVRQRHLLQRRRGAQRTPDTLPFTH